MDNPRFANNEERISYLNEQHEKMARKQEDNLVIDFDKAIQENKKTIIVKFLNKNYHLSADVPFRFSTFFLRHCLKKVNGKTFVDIPDEKALQFIEYMFGEDFVQAIESCKDTKVTNDLVFSTLVPPILKQWGWDTNQNKNIEKKRKMI